MNINKAVDKAFESKSLKEIADAPLDALEGVSAGDAELLAKVGGSNPSRATTMSGYIPKQNAH